MPPMTTSFFPVLFEHRELSRRKGNGIQGKNSRSEPAPGTEGRQDPPAGGDQSHTEKCPEKFHEKIHLGSESRARYRRVQ